MLRHDFLAALHESVAPRTYLETGVYDGSSLKLSRVPSVGVDPAFMVTEELQADVHLARTTSDEFFARRRPIAHLPIPVVDFGFIDGMHLAEYALRDFAAIERFTLPTSVVVFDDALPRTVEMANRKRTTRGWTGDVFKAVAALRELRPDLLVLEVDTTPTGTAVVLFPDASLDGVLPGYDDWLVRTVVPDPQAVPDEVIARTRAIKPEDLLASPGWRKLAGLRDHVRPGSAGPVRDVFPDLIQATASVGVG